MSAPIAVSDAELLRDVYLRHRISVLRLVKSRLSSSDSATLVAEDIVSETFLRAAQHIGQLRRFADNVLPWLFRVAGNLVHDHQKSAYVARRVVVDELPDRAVDDFSPERELLRHWQITEVRRGVAALSAVQRQCLQLRFVDRLSVADTAVLMERTPAALRQLQHRAVTRLGVVLGDTGPDLAEVA